VPYRDIAKEVHMSFGDISAIIRRHTGEPEKKQQQQKEEEPTTDTKVFRLLEEGKSPVQVATGLNLPADEVERIQRVYYLLPHP
jgi:hypothetical protein